MLEREEQGVRERIAQVVMNEAQGMTEQIARVVMSGVQIVLGENQIRMVGMVCESLAIQNCPDGILQLVAALEEVVEASPEGCSLSG